MDLSGSMQRAAGVADLLLITDHSALGTRRKQHHNRDVWWLRFHWAREKPRIQQDLLAGTYRFDAVQIYRTSEGAFESWSARDALVLKALAIVLGGHLRMKRRATPRQDVCGQDQPG
jgi:RNA-directed DNA polymerase